MDGKKIYSITINGISESINAVDALNKQLLTLENRIKELEKSNVKINASGGGSKSSSSSLSEEAAIQKEINKLKQEGATLDAKIVAAQDEVYKRVDATKQLYKETIADQKAMAAQERLTADAYSNTMQGMKQHLADLKAVINTTDMGDADKINQMTKDANELTNKLKEMEQAYGQFGRNVGNYANGVAEGLQKVKIAVGDDVREFDNAKQAAKALGNELKTMAVNGQQGTKEFKDLQKAVAQLNSDIKDATVSSKAMDNLLDTMQSFAAIGSVTQGMSALFGFDDAEIQKSIQKLVALQNVMQGIEKINQQMNSSEGIGGWISKGNAAIDTLVAKLTGANKAQLALNASTTAGKTASEGLTAAETAQATATAGATVATKALSLALKTLGIGLIVSAVAYLITYWKDIYKWFTDTIPVLKNLETWFGKIEAVVMGVGSAIVNWLVQPLATVIKVIQALKEGKGLGEIGTIISEGVKKQFDVIGNFQKGYNRESERQQKAHNDKMRAEQKKANEEAEKDAEAKYGTDLKRTKEFYKKQLALTEKGTEEYKELQRKVWETERREKEENQKKNKAAAQKNEKEDKELRKLRIENMKDGIDKTIALLEFERDERLKTVKKGSEMELEIITLYANKIEEATKEHTANMKAAYDSMWEEVYATNMRNFRMNSDAELTALDTKLQKDIEKLQEGNNRRYSGYQTKYPSNLSKENATRLGVLEQMPDGQGLKDAIRMAKEYLDLKAEIDLQKARQSYWIDDESIQEEVDNAEKALQDWLDKNEKSVEEMEEWYTVQKLIQSNYTESLSKSFDIRINLSRKYYSDAEELQKKHSEETLANEKSLLDKEYNDEMAAENKRFDDQLARLEENREKGLITEEQYNKQSERIYEENAEAYIAITNKRDAELERLEQEHQDRMKDVTRTSLNARIQEYNDFYYAIGNLESRQPETLGKWGIVDLKATKKNYKEALDAYTHLCEEIQQEKADLQLKLDAKEISFDDFQQANRELNDLETMTADAVKHVQDNLDNLGGMFMQSINQYVQEAFNSLNTIMNAVWNAQDVAFDKEQEQIDKTNDALDKALDKQQEIIEQHKSAIDSIEDELATARGDRRQHLIDQINAEIEAQRAAQKEEEKIKKQQEAQQRKQDELDKKRKKAEYHRNLLQAIVNGAMAVTMAAVNNWPIPAIPMMALAASTTAAQIAIMAANKPYAKGGQLDGGVAQGKRHSEGGIPVLGGRASIEGGEFITNRQTTAKNVDLLEYINAKHRKLDIDDFIDFYSSGKVKKSITSMSPRAKFADGGVIPTLNNEYQFDDRLLSAFEDYSNRPVYVSVVDINSRQAAVKNVQVLAGLGE